MIVSNDTKSKVKDAKDDNQNKLAGDDVSNPILRSFIAGALSGTCSTILLQPLDLIKTRLQQSPSSSIWSVVNHVAKQEGISGFWTGVTPSLWRTVPGIGLYFSCYHTLSDMVTTKDMKRDRMTSMQSMMVGTLARICAGVLLIPITVVKTRWEATGSKFQYKGKGMMVAIKTIMAKEGARGLVAGLVPTIVRDAPYSGIYLMFYNNLKYLLVTKTEEGKEKQVLHFLCGLLAGAMATMIVQPADVVKTHLQLVQGKMSAKQVMRGIYKTRGLGGFMVGAGPRVLRKSLMSALAWSVYEQATAKIVTKL